MRDIDLGSVALLLLLFSLAASAVGYFGYSYRGAEDCRKAGGTNVRTFSGYVCAKLEVITP